MTSKHLTISSIEHNMYFFNLGNHFNAYDFLGAKKTTIDGVSGYRFTVWAPHAKAVGLIGSFNDWREEPMAAVNTTGAWTLFKPEAKQWDLYKFVITGHNGIKKEKQDPFALAAEIPPNTASVIQDMPDYLWQDKAWYEKRQTENNYQKPLNIYEVHMSSWRRHADGSAYTFADLQAELIPYVKKMGYTHIEFMPLMEHPLEASWGYQISGYFSIAGRFGHDLQPLMMFVDAAHQAGIGVICDWVPGHFVVNDDAMALYDGTPTFEFQDPIRAKNNRWGTLNFDLGKTQVHSFLVSSALFWLEKMHFDGLRVDAVSNMLYLDYDIGEWMPNIHGNNVNLEGVDFLRKLNKEVFLRDPSYLMIAEESTAWSGVTASIDHGGLGFNYKWNMGWMNDTLKFFKFDPVYRAANYKLITFTFMYMFDENFVLPFSHDEVVHGKDSLLGRMPGDRYAQFANLRAMEGYRLVYPGKKLSFMGNEIGQFLEWRCHSQLEWGDLARDYNTEFNRYIQDINRLYLSKKALHQNDLSAAGITILEADNAAETIIAFIRHAIDPNDFIVCVNNFTPIERPGYRVGVPFAGAYRVLLNSEMRVYGGNWDYQVTEFMAEAIPHHNQPYSIEIVLPSLSAFLLEPVELLIEERPIDLSRAESAAAARESDDEDLDRLEEEAV